MSSKNALADRYDRVASSAPINADAARAANMRGDHEPAYNLGEREHWEAPPKTITPPTDKAHRVGKKYGSLTVIGYLGGSRRGSKWLVRCLCNRYEVRIGKSVDRAAPNDGCQRCQTIKQRQRQTKRQAYFDRFGKWPADNY